MADKKKEALPAKGQVKFEQKAQNDKYPQPEDPSKKKVVVQYKDVREQKELALKTYNKVQTQFKMFTNQDPNCRRKDTALALTHLLDQLKETMSMLNIGTFDDKATNYYLLYNATIYMFDICRVLRKSVYQSLVIEYLAFCISSIEGNLTLISIKYLDWRIKLYLELAHIYYSLQSPQCALRTIECALQKVQELRETEEVDPPLPDYIDKTLRQNQRILRILEIKFRQLPGPDAWRKKIDEYFLQDKEGRIQAIIESLRMPPPNQSNTIRQTSIGTSKEGLVSAAWDILKNDVEKITLGLEQQMEKLSYTVDFRTSLKAADEDQRMELTKKKREFEGSLLKEKDWRSIVSIPLEYHVELASHAFDVGNFKLFEEISNTAFIRCKYRRIEVPYISDINILVSNTPNPNIPNGYEKIPVDINEASLRMELRKLRNRSKNQAEETKKEEVKKDDKKKPTQLQQQQQQPQQDQVGMGVQATESELIKINHTYVYLVYKRSYLPENAIYEIDVVMADENDGPVEKLNEGWRAIAIPIKQYTGVRETNKTIPYLIIKHSDNNLQNQQEKMTLLIDLKPLFGKHPQIRPDMGYQKIGCDLRQIPQEFIRSPNMDYVYLTYKNDKFYYTNEREIQIMIHYYQLEKSYQKEISVSIDDDSRLELDICYDIEKLSALMKMIGSCLVGPLGEQFLNERKDFLNQLVFQLWKKYYVGPLYQFEFIQVIEFRFLNYFTQELLISREISEDDYDRYKSIINKGKVIFKEGMIVFNQILFKLPQVDIVLLCKISQLIIFLK